MTQKDSQKDNMTPRMIVTGSDTNVGKTVVAAWLLHHGGGAYWKAIQCGRDENGADDSSRVASLGGTIAAPPAYDFQLARSPHEAAAAEGITIALDQLTPPIPDDAPLIIEGAGGVMVPLNDSQFMIDAFALWQASAIVVARTALGTINHTCLTLQALRLHGIEVAGVVLVGDADDENASAIEHYGDVSVVGHLPFHQPLSEEFFSNHPPYDTSLLSRL